MKSASASIGFAARPGSKSHSRCRFTGASCSVSNTSWQSTVEARECQLLSIPETTQTSSACTVIKLPQAGNVGSRQIPGMFRPCKVVYAITCRSGCKCNRRRLRPHRLMAKFLSGFALRLAREVDAPALERLIPLSVWALQAPFYSAAQIGAALVAELRGEIAGCAG